MAMSLLLFFLPLSSQLHAADIQVGTPTHAGTDTFTITPTGKEPVPITVTIDEDDLPMTRKEKAAAVAAAINLEFSAKPELGVVATVNAGGNIELQGATGLAGKATTGETDKFSFNDRSPTDGPVLSQIDLHLKETFASLAGIDSGGNPATYTAGFEFSSPSLGDIALSTTLGFSDLTTPTLNGLLQQEFDIFQNQLMAQAPSLVSGLSLNLSEGAIVFQPVGFFTSASVENGTTDLALASTLSISSVPDSSSTIVMLATSLVFLGFAQRRIASGAIVARSSR